MSKHSKNRRQGDPVQVPGSLTDQIHKDHNVTNQKSRQKQKRKYDDEEDEQVCFLFSFEISFRNMLIQLE